MFSRFSQPSTIQSFWYELYIWHLEKKFWISTHIIKKKGKVKKKRGGEIVMYTLVLLECHGELLESLADSLGQDKFIWKTSD